MAKVDLGTCALSVDGQEAYKFVIQKQKKLFLSKSEECIDLRCSINHTSFDLEKGFGKMSKFELWNALHIYGIEGCLLSAIKECLKNYSAPSLQ